jgi:hypothetical protein
MGTEPEIAVEDAAVRPRASRLGDQVSTRQAIGPEQGSQPIAAVGAGGGRTSTLPS